MKIAASENVIERSGLDNETSFKIKASAKAFKILLDGLYSNKIGAPIREISCNAYDAHVAVGKADVPFEVHLPNQLEPWFSIRDFGPGLSDEDIKGLYTTIFESTKNNSNDFVGAFGLGSKSPFSYVDSFSVISYFEGKKRMYTAYFTEEGVPSISLIHTEDSDEASGLEVQMPVKDLDFKTFEKNAKFYLQFFSPRPVINLPEFEFEIQEPILKGNDWAYYGKTTWRRHKDIELNGVRAIQGHVPYDVDRHAFSNISIPEQVDFILKNLALEVKFPIGSLEVAASREALSYNKSTTLNIINKLEEIYKELSRDFWEKADAFVGSDWERCKFNDKLRHQDTTLFDHFNEVAGNKLKLHTYFDFKKFDDVKLLYKTSGYKRSIKFKEIDKKEGKMRIAPDDNLKIYVQDTEVPQTWFQHYFETNNMSWKDTAVLVLRASEKFTIEKILEELGNPDYTLTSTLVKPPRKPRMTTPPLFIDTHKPSKYTQHTFKEQELPSEGFYMPYVRNRVEYNDNRFENWPALVNLATENDWIDETIHDKIFVLTKAQMKEIKDNKDWVNLFDFLIEKLKEYMVKNAEQYFKYYQAKNSDVSWHVVRVFEAVKGNKSFKNIKNTPLAKVIKIYNEYKDTTIDSHMKTIAEMFGIAPDIASVNLTKINDALKEAWDRYPLLSLISMSSNYIEDSTGNSIIEYVEMIESKLTSA